MKLMFKRLTGVFIGAALSGAAMAADTPNTLASVDNVPAQILSNQSMSTYLAIMSEKEASDGISILEGARIDHAIGLMCEWKVSGRVESNSEQGFIYSDVKKLSSSCIPTTEIPRAWRGRKAIPMEQLMHVANNMAHQDPARPGIVIEKSETVTFGNVVNKMMRQWDIMKREVCLITSEGTRNHMGTKDHFTNDWGCYPVTNNAHFEAMLRTLKISQPL